MTEHGQHKTRLHKILVKFYSVNPSLSPHFVKPGHLFFSIYFIIFSCEFCRLAEYSTSRDNPRDFSKQTVLNYYSSINGYSRNLLIRNCYEKIFGYDS